MTKRFGLRGIIVFITLCLFSFSSFSQIKEIQIEFIGNCGLHMTDGTTNFYIDFPYKSGAFNYMEFENAELDSIKDNSIFIFTHKHSDHYSKKNLKKVLKEKKGQTYGPWNIAELGQLGETIPDFSIKAFKTEHKVFGISFKHYSYLINWHGKKIYLSGDTGKTETIGKISDIDWAFIPYWLYKNAKDQNVLIDAKMVGIYHLYPVEVAPAEQIFQNSEDHYPLTKQGERISIKIE